MTAIAEEVALIVAKEKFKNPFYYGGPILPDSFVGHQAAVDFCRAKLTGRQPANITIGGERRTGKTSLLHYLNKFGSQKAWGQNSCLSRPLQMLVGRWTYTATIHKSG